MITNLLPKPHEIIEQSIMFNEAMRGFGYKCTMLIPKVVELPDVGYMQNIGYDDSDKFIVNISIDPSPKTKLLQSLGWNIEDDETKPMICYISKYIQDYYQERDVNTKVTKIVPTKYTRLILEYDYFEKGKEFIVTSVSGDQFNPIYYIMKIVPYRPAEVISPNPLQDNNVLITNIEETEQSFRFLNKDRFKEVDIKY